MKKQIYFSIIGIGALLAIIGFIPGGMSGTWGILITAITAGLYFINTKNDQKVQERLSQEEGMLKQDAEPDSAESAETESDSEE